jgi:chromosome segregation ATPase
MPESEHLEVPDRVSEVDAILDRLSEAVGRVASELESVTERAASCEGAYEKLRKAVKGAEGAPVPANVEERLAQLNEENQRLRDVLEKARERANRIRTRLEVVEDEL